MVTGWVLVMQSSDDVMCEGDGVGDGVGIAVGIVVGIAVGTDCGCCGVGRDGGGVGVKIKYADVISFFSDVVCCGDVCCGVTGCGTVLVGCDDLWVVTQEVPDVCLIGFSPDCFPYFCEEFRPDSFPCFSF